MGNMDDLSKQQHTQEDEMDEAESEHSSSDGSDSSDDDAELIQSTAKLEEQLLVNPYEYESYKELIKQYKMLGELDKLRTTREKFHSHYPLTEELWMEWIEDEKRLTYSDDEKHKVLKLYGRAVQDYLSLNLWTEYCSYAIGTCDTSSCREIMESAAAAIGRSPSNGKLVWDLRIEFETALLSAIKPGDDGEPTDQFNTQSDMVTKIYQQLMVLPLEGVSTIPDEYQSLTGSPPSEALRDRHKQALELLQKFRSFEQLIEKSTDGESKVTWYRKYLNFCKKNCAERVELIVCLYERAVAAYPLDASTWLDYTQYQEKNLKENESMLSVYKRAIRNVPWIGSIWSAYCLRLEKTSTDFSLIRAEFELALQSGLTLATDYLTLWLSYCDFIRRSIDWEQPDEERVAGLRELFTRAIEFQLKHYGEEGDLACELPKYSALIEAKCLRNLENAREIWNESLTGYRNGKANAWLEYVSFERMFGDHKHTRRVLQRALKAVTDWPESVCAEYLRFEREEGTLDQLYVAQNRVSDVRAQLAAKFPQKHKRDGGKFSQHKKPNQKKDFRPPSKDNQDKKKKPVTTLKSPMDTSEGPTQQSEGPKVFKRKKETPVLAASASSSDADFKMPAAPPPAKKIKTSPESSKELTQEPKSSDGSEKSTVFVSNLSFNVTEPMISRIFEPKCGPVKEVRIMKGKGDKSKGFGYVEFNDQLGAQKALTLDRYNIDGRAMYVSESTRSRDTNAPKLKFDTGLEKSKLFVSGLSYGTSQETIQKLFEKHGKVKEVRVVTFKGGKSKGLAYVEFHDELTAKNALLAVDGTELEGFTLKVALSNPPARNAPQTRSTFVPSLGGASKVERDRQPRGKAKTQLSFMPRVTVVKPTVVKPSLNKSAAAEKPEAALTAGSENSGNMSNNDFRNMLLGKK